MYTFLSVCLSIVYVWRGRTFGNWFSQTEKPLLTCSLGSCQSNWTSHCWNCPASYWVLTHRSVNWFCSSVAYLRVTHCAHCLWPRSLSFCTCLAASQFSSPLKHETLGCRWLESGHRVSYATTKSMEIWLGGLNANIHSSSKVMVTVSRASCIHLTWEGYTESLSLGRGFLCQRSEAQGLPWLHCKLVVNLGSVKSVAKQTGSNIQSSALI